MPPKQTPSLNDGFQALQDQLAAMMSRLEAQQLEIDALRQTQSRFSSSSPASGAESLQLVKEPTVSKPEPFSGTEDLPIFLQQCELSFELQPSRFPTDYHKVGFVLSYLRGPAARWARPYLSNKTHEVCQDLSKFTTAIEEAFGDPTRQMRSTVELRALKQTTTVALYAAEFQAISSNLKWNDEALCSQFYDGLEDTVKDEISKNPPTTLHEFITMATRIDNRRIERPSFKTPVSTIKDPPTKSTPLLKNPKLDAEEVARCKAEKRCYRCREIGHRVVDCPLNEGKEKEAVHSIFTIGGPPSNLPMNLARRTGPREVDVKWSTSLAEQAP